jgi:hypothetical protein
MSASHIHSKRILNRATNTRPSTTRQDNVATL